MVASRRGSDQRRAREAQHKDAAVGGPLAQVAVEMLSGSRWVLARPLDFQVSPYLLYQHRHNMPKVLVEVALRDGGTKRLMIPFDSGRTFEWLTGVFITRHIRT